ncbi:hypothetical protein FRC12_006743 [Ceratobasidium sp. 428]|nr:hypothetical protein FRC12_006743 [Ceratobasidium sp. 428]
MLPKANSAPIPLRYSDKRLTCPYCRIRLNTRAGRRIHILLHPPCRARYELFKLQQRERKRREREENEANEPLTKRLRADEDIPQAAGPSRPPPPNSQSPGPPSPDSQASSLIDAGDGSFIETFSNAAAGAPISPQKRGEKDLPEYLEKCGRLGDHDLFETAEILMTTGLNSAGRTKHLKGPIYKQWKGKGKAVWGNDDELMREIDRLPMGPKWTTVQVTAGKGKYKRTHTVYLRDVLAVIRQLIGARRFKRWMKYAPERHWTSRDRKCRAYDEMWSGEWWWRTQVSAGWFKENIRFLHRVQLLIGNKNGTVVPLIVASDETTMANNPRGPKGHPVYLSIGNISKVIRRKPTKRAMVLIGYLPTDSYGDVADLEIRRQYRGELLHRSLEKIFEPLKTASSDGLLAWCADGYCRHIYPIIASWIADWPEQNNLACTTQGGCPKCMQGWKGRGDRGPRVPPRDPDDTLEALKAYKKSKKPAVLTALRLRAIEPFWAGIPHMDIGNCLTPDLLHQLYKGMFEHARDWVEDLLGTEEFNRRFKKMPGAKDLRHFKKGVTTVKNWAGRETRDMMRQFLPIVVDAQAPADFVRMIRALLDFSYIAHGARLTDIDLEELDNALEAFHKTKGVLLANKMVKADGFNRIAKLHMLSHYTDDIRELGTPDGYSTETPEYLHIVYVKIPWRMSNRRNPFPQMVKYVRRLEAIHIHRTAIDEYYGERKGADEEEIRLALKLLEDTSENETGNDSESKINGDGDSSDNGGSSDSDSDSGGESDTENDEDGDELEEESDKSAIAGNTYYPRPSIRIAQQPTVRHVPGHVLISSYGCSDFVRVVRGFLLSKIGQKPLLLLPSDTFNVWHKATLFHPALPFAPGEPRHRDVVRVQPPTRDKAGRVNGPGVFDTALFPIGRGLGISGFRAGRVRAIFTLPRHVYHIYSRPLVFVDLYTPFSADATSSHRLYQAVPSRSETHPPASVVLPLASIAMACHLAPDFSSPRLDQYLLNDYYNHFTFLLMVYWRRLNANRLT